MYKGRFEVKFLNLLTTRSRTTHMEDIFTTYENIYSKSTSFSGCILLPQFYLYVSALSYYPWIWSCTPICFSQLFFPWIAQQDHKCDSHVRIAFLLAWLLPTHPYGLNHSFFVSLRLPLFCEYHVLIFRKSNGGSSLPSGSSHLRLFFRLWLSGFCFSWLIDWLFFSWRFNATTNFIIVGFRCFFIIVGSLMVWSLKNSHLCFWKSSYHLDPIGGSRTYL